MAHKKGSPGYSTKYLNVRKSIQKFIYNTFQHTKNPFQSLFRRGEPFFFFEEDTPKIATIQFGGGQGKEIN